MRTLGNTFKTEKNKRENRPIWLYAIYDYDGQSNNLYYAEYDGNVTYNGQEYTRFPITHEFISENIQGEVDAIRLKLSNVSRLIQGYLEVYDWRGKKVSIKMVWADHLDDADAYIEDIFYIDSYTTDQEEAVFTLTSKFDLMEVRLPIRRYFRNYCIWSFKSTECGYAGGQSECNKTLTRCKVLSNQERFGGFPSIPSKHLIFG